jgi:hypothetical protein
MGHRQIKEDTERNLLFLEILREQRSRLWMTAFTSTLCSMGLEREKSRSSRRIRAIRLISSSTICRCPLLRLSSWL